MSTTSGAPKRRRSVATDTGLKTQRRYSDVRELHVALEFQRHIHRVTVLAQAPATCSSNTPLQCTVKALNDKALLQFAHAALPPVCVQVPWPVVPGSYAASFSDGYVFTIPTKPIGRTCQPPPSSPWHEFAQKDIDALQCARCAQTLVQFTPRAHLRALPSEHWEELVDAWMCHGDQRLNASVTQGRRDVDVHRVPRDDELWVSSLWLKTSSASITSGVCIRGEAQDNFSEVRIISDLPCTDQQKSRHRPTYRG